MKRSTVSERALVLAPLGRDTALAIRMLGDAGVAAEPCASLPHLIEELNVGAAVVVVTEEALATADLGPLSAWLADQEKWSDLPFVLLTSQGGGIERNPAARRYLDVLGNATFIERPFHPTTLVSLVRSAVRGRRRQYEARARLEALRASEGRFRAAVDAVQGILWTNNAAGEMEGDQPGWEALTGQGADEYQGFGWSQAVHPDDAQPTVDAWNAAVAAKTTFVYEHRVRRHDGAWRRFSIRAIPIIDGAGRIGEWVGVHTDVTQQRSHEKQLRELAETLEHRVAERTAELGRVWRLSQNLLVVADTDGVLSAVNAAWTALLGWDEDELVGATFMQLTHPDELEATLEIFAGIAATPLVVPHEYRLRHKDGTYRWFAWTAAFENGAIYATGRDVTAEKQQADALAKAEEALRQAQKMEAVGQLTGGVAHDFNNLLTIIKSSTEFLRRTDLADERRRRYVDAISDTVDRAAKLTGQLLAFARRQTLKPEAFDVADRVNAITDMLGTLVGSRIRIVIDAPEERCVVTADTSQFETAIVNMAVNARDAMNGEGMLTLKVAAVTAMPAIRSHAGSPGAFVAVSLTDTGEGIPADKLPQIFEPFFTTKEVGKGTGLGLSQVYGFAKQSGGDVAVASEPGRGATFTLYLPRKDAVDAVASAAASEASEPIEHGEGRRILVVEDNVEVGKFSTQILQDLGYETIWASNADEALKMLDEANGFDAVFSDVVMPGMSGVELGQQVRRRHPGLPVVLTSGYSHVLAEEGRHGFELLQKPYAAEELSRVLHRAMRGRRPGKPSVATD